MLDGRLGSGGCPPTAHRATRAARPRCAAPSLAGFARRGGPPLAVEVQVMMCTPIPPPSRITRDVIVVMGCSAADQVRRGWGGHPLGGVLGGGGRPQRRGGGGGRGPLGGAAVRSGALCALARRGQVGARVGRRRRGGPRRTGRRAAPPGG